MHARRQASPIVDTDSSFTNSSRSSAGKAPRVIKKTCCDTNIERGSLKLFLLSLKYFLHSTGGDFCKKYFFFCTICRRTFFPIPFHLFSISFSYSLLPFLYSFFHISFSLFHVSFSLFHISFSLFLFPYKLMRSLIFLLKSPLNDVNGEHAHLYLPFLKISLKQLSSLHPSS